MTGSPQQIAQQHVGITRVRAATHAHLPWHVYSDGGAAALQAHEPARMQWERVRQLAGPGAVGLPVGYELAASRKAAHPKLLCFMRSSIAVGGGGSWGCRIMKGCLTHRARAVRGRARVWESLLAGGPAAVAAA